MERTPVEQAPQPISFETSPDRYRHWRLEAQGATARLVWDVQEDRPLRPGYVLKLNSYDLGVDIELADAVQRLRFEHPEVGAVAIVSGKERVFSAGANIHMLASSSHSFKVNFCKFTNETRLAIEDAGAASGQRYLAACNGVTAGGGYELALACDEIVLVDDGSSAVSLPEVPLLGVLPGTGGLTRLSDKRRVRRDHADIFCTTAEGVKGQRALDWRLVDAIALGVKAGENELAYTLLHVGIDRRARTATFRLHGPDGRPPADALALRREGSGTWMLRLFRELDDAICRLRFNEEEIGVWLFKTEGDPDLVASHDAALSRLAPSDWFAREVLLLTGRVLRRMDVTARTLFALVEPGSCFAGCLLEISLACDRAYALDDPGRAVGLRLSPLNFGALPMGHGPARLHTRFLHRPEALAAL
ncbi:MAG: enoyl-CoA hydratase/isomerase family protein, partial [Candidatus Rokubacteria bacterium]|nr:enoyl-CoA hydratase/isomerase family protein [Candidatus Rokubacteria bacterium]